MTDSFRIEAAGETLVGSYIRLVARNSGGGRINWRVASGDAHSANLDDSDSDTSGFSPQSAGVFQISAEALSADGTVVAKAIVSVAISRPNVVIAGPNECEQFMSSSLFVSKTALPESTEFNWTVTGPKGGGYIYPWPTDTSHVEFLPEVRGEFVVSVEAKFQLSTRDGSFATGICRADHQVRVMQSVHRGGADVDLIWRSKMEEDRTKLFELTQRSATQWESGLTALLGIFGTVAFVTGPKTLSEITSIRLKITAAMIIALSIALVFYSRLLLADVSGALPKLTKTLEPMEYRQRMFRTAVASAKKVRTARTFAVLGASVLAAGALFISVASLSPQKTKPTILLVRSGGKLLCGQIKTDKAGYVSIAGEVLLAVDEVKIVDRC